MQNYGSSSNISKFTLAEGCLQSVFVTGVSITMVSPAISVPAVRKSKSFFLRHLRHPEDSLAHVQSEYEAIDFSDVFGPDATSTQISQLYLTSKGKSLSGWDVSGMLCINYPEVIKSRSHSLVGPSPGLGLVRQPSKVKENDTQKSLRGNMLEDVEVIDTGCLFEPNNQPLLSSSHGLDELLSCQVKVSQSLGLEDFQLLKVVGQGAFGKVYQVKRNGTSEVYAMKVMRKDRIMEKNHAEYMKAERDILTKIVHPFIVQLRYSFQTKYKLYLVLDFINGGHLFFQLYRQGLFSEDLARVYIAEIVSAVSHLHKNGVMHRDLKPENILLDAEGHVKLTDFGLAKEIDESARSNSMCGTTEYMAPEIILAKGHDKAADWWSVGILLYEMLTGQPPFTSNNRQKIQQKITKDKIKLPSFLTSEAHSLLKGLLQKDPSKRLGCGTIGSDEIKRHKWFKSINWKRLEARGIQPAFKPNVSGKLCIANFDDFWTSMPVQDSPSSTPRSGDHYFQGYTYVAPNALLPVPDKGSYTKPQD
eukprot:Gb_28905 [translate_table: standard]